MDLFQIQGYRVERIWPEDAPRLQPLYERCGDYHEEHEGVPTHPTAAAESLESLPSGSTMDDKLSLAVSREGGEPLAYMDLIRDSPAPGEWQLGLLMVDPDHRGSGLGRRFYEAAAAWIARQGGRSVLLGVLEHAPRAERFWRRMGFEELRRHPYRSPVRGKESRLIVMRHRLPDAPA